MLGVQWESERHWLSQTRVAKLGDFNWRLTNNRNSIHDCYLIFLSLCTCSLRYSIIRWHLREQICIYIYTEHQTAIYYTSLFLSLSCTNDFLSFFRNTKKTFIYFMHCSFLEFQRLIGSQVDIQPILRYFLDYLIHHPYSFIHLR